MVENLFQIVTKSDALSPHRYTLIIQKVGCPVGCSEWLPVSVEFFKACVEGEIIQLRMTRVPMTVDEAHKFVAGHRPQPLQTGDWQKCKPGSSCSVEYEMELG